MCSEHATLLQIEERTILANGSEPVRLGYVGLRCAPAIAFPYLVLRIAGAFHFSSRIAGLGQYARM